MAPRITRGKLVMSQRLIFHLISEIPGIYFVVNLRYCSFSGDPYVVILSFVDNLFACATIFTE